jgi:thiol-disulfide isomerase/thioredoxin
LLLAGVFALSGVAKLADRAGSRQAIIAFGLPRSLARPLGRLLPLAELAVAAALLPALTAWWGAWAALALLVAFVVGMGANLALGRRPECRCFGRLRSARVGPKTLARDGLLMAVAALVVWEGGEDAGPSALGWVGGLTVAQLSGLLLGLLIVALLGVQGWFIFHLLRQNGRVLVRLRALEAASGAVSSSAEGSRRGAGLPVGSVAPSFGLRDLRGERHTLEGLRAGGKPVVLIFLSPSCHSCAELLPQIARWQREHAEELTIWLISEPSIEEEGAEFAEHGLEEAVVHEDGEVADSYGVEATPSAVLVSPTGAIGSPLAEGPEAIGALVAKAIGSHAGSAMAHRAGARATREGEPAAPLEVGEAVPEVRLSDLKGGEVSLADLGGEETLLLFWSPGCGYCQKMLPDLKRLEADRAAGAPEIVVVSEGTEEENSRMGLRSAVLLDNEYAVEEAFGVEGTPSAVLVDGQGRIASKVALGARGVFELARAGR